MNTGMNPPTEGGAKASSPKYKKETRQFKSKAPKVGMKQRSFDSLPGMDGLGDIYEVCPWEEFGDIEQSDLAQIGIV